ncbi:MAG TPA: transglycosylase SLT domain-containing protein [Longimicrobiales bacterium]|nr:transglycosylase SLT domain-containing protein [Longimicrobiales bacterium]
MIRLPPGHAPAMALAGLLVAAGCGVRVPPPPGPVEAPRVVMGDHGPAPDAQWGWKPPPPPAGEAPDPILHSPWARDPEIRREVEAWMDRFTVREGAWFAAYLARMGRYAPLVDSTLAVRDLPSSLRYLPIVESGYHPGAVSRASAAGLWQFMAPVARGFGMRVDAVVDERRDPVRATPAALQFLDELHQRFGSWFLALAAYNGGPSRVDALLRQYAPLSPPGDSLYLVIRPHLPRETREFIPKFLAASTLASHPEAYGLAAPELLSPLAYDVVTVPDATTLDVVAAAAGVPEAEVLELNPQILRGVTPRGRATELRVPAGRGEAFAAAYALVPPNERVTVTEHVVAKGETLSEIAQQYGIRTAELQAANPRVQPRRMRVGTRLLVPLVPRRGS